MAGRVIPFPSRAPEPPEPGNERGFEELTRVGDQAEALVVRGLLQAHGIGSSCAARSRLRYRVLVWASRARSRSSSAARRSPRAASSSPGSARVRPFPLAARRRPLSLSRRRASARANLERLLHGGQHRQLERLRQAPA